MRVARTLRLAIALGALVFMLLPTASPTVVLERLAFAFAFFAASFVGALMPQGDSAEGDESIAIAALFLLDPSVSALAAVAGESSAKSVRTETPLDFLVWLLRVMLLYALGAARVVLLPDGLELLRDIRPVLVLIAAYGLADLALTSLRLAYQRRQSPWRVFTGLTSIMGSMYVAQVSIGLVIALLYDSVGFVALLVMLVLVVVMRHSFNLYLRIRTGYQRVVEALAGTAERLQPSKKGHSRRVALGSVAVGRALGLRGTAVDQLNYAALLHDIGAICSSTYEPNRSIPYTDPSARLISDIAFLRSVAPIVEVANRPECEFEYAQDRVLLLSARIVRLLSRVDDVLCEQGARVEHLERAVSEALADLNLGFDVQKAARRTLLGAASPLLERPATEAETSVVGRTAA